MREEQGRPAGGDDPPVDFGHLQSWIHRSVDDHEITVPPQGVDEPSEIREPFLVHGEVDCPLAVAAPQARTQLRSEPSPNQVRTKSEPSPNQVRTKGGWVLSREAANPPPTFDVSLVTDGSPRLR